MYLLAAWRYFLAVLAGTGALYFLTEWLSLRTFTVQVDLSIAVVYAWLATRSLIVGRTAVGRSGLRGGLVVFALLMGILYTVFGGTLALWQSILAHVVVPLMVLADWLFVGRAQARLEWWHPFAWLAYPLAYLVMTLVVAGFVDGAARFQYRFLDPTRPHFGLLLIIYAGLILALGYAVVASSKLAKGRTKIQQE